MRSPRRTRPTTSRPEPARTEGPSRALRERPAPSAGQEAAAIRCEPGEALVGCLGHSGRSDGCSTSFGIAPQQALTGKAQRGPSQPLPAGSERTRGPVNVLAGLEGRSRLSSGSCAWQRPSPPHLNTSVKFGNVSLGSRPASRPAHGRSALRPKAVERVRMPGPSRIPVPPKRGSKGAELAKSGRGQPSSSSSALASFRSAVSKPSVNQP